MHITTIRRAATLSLCILALVPIVIAAAWFTGAFSHEHPYSFSELLSTNLFAISFLASSGTLLLLAHILHIDLKTKAALYIVTFSLNIIGLLMMAVLITTNLSP